MARKSRAFARLFLVLIEKQNEWPQQSLVETLYIVSSTPTLISYLPPLASSHLMKQYLRQI